MIQQRIVAICLVCLALSGCAGGFGLSAETVASGAGVIQTSAQSKHETITAIAKAKRKLAEQASCHTTTGDYFSMGSFERALWAYRCGYADSIPTIMMGFPVQSIPAATPADATSIQIEGNSQ